MVDLGSAPALGFLGGVLGGTLAQFGAFLRRRKRDLDRLRSVLKEIEKVSESQLEDAEDELQRLENGLKQARLEASYLLDEDQREKIDRVENEFDYTSREAGSNSTCLISSSSEKRFEDYSREALDSLQWQTIGFVF